MIKSEMTFMTTRFGGIDKVNITVCSNCSLYFECTFEHLDDCPFCQLKKIKIKEHEKSRACSDDRYVKINSGNSDALCFGTESLRNSDICSGCVYDRSTIKDCSNG